MDVNRTIENDKWKTLTDWEENRLKGIEILVIHRNFTILLFCFDIYVCFKYFE